MHKIKRSAGLQVHMSSMREDLETWRLGNRKGGIHTLEALMAFIMVLGFIIFVMPSLRSGDTSAITRNHVLGSLSNLEKTGRLGELAVAGNLSGIVAELNRTIAPPQKFTVGISKLSVIAGTLSPREAEAAYFNFTANASTLESVSLELEYQNAASPAVYVNGMQAAYHAGDYSGKSETLGITQYAVSGPNSAILNTSNNATIRYRLRLTDSVELGTTPGNRTINTVSYLVAGDKNTFQPTEIRVYVWR